MADFLPHASLGLLVKRAQQALRVALDAALAEAGLTTAQYATIAAVAEEPGLSNADLARRVFVTPQTVHGVVQGLEGAGWVERIRGSGRAVEIRLTDSGRDALHQGHRAAAAVERQMTATLSSAEIERAKAALLDCCSALETR